MGILFEKNLLSYRNNLSKSLPTTTPAVSVLLAQLPSLQNTLQDERLSLSEQSMFTGRDIVLGPGQHPSGGRRVGVRALFSEEPGLPEGDVRSLR